MNANVRFFIIIYVMELTALAWFASAATSAVERILAEGRIETNLDFEGESAPPMMSGKYDAPLSAQKGEGALGSAGFLRVGPHTFHYVGAEVDVPFVVAEDTWLGFSARKEGGGVVGLMFADQRQNKNVNASAKLPADGSWGTFRIDVSKLSMSMGTPVNNISFGVANRAQSPVAFYLDNICLGHGRPDDIPFAPAEVKAQTTNGMAVVTWQAPDSLCGLMEYRVYRGFHPDFARDQRHFVGRIQKNIFSDNAFFRPTTYYYAVRAIDFAGNESRDAGAVFVNLSGEK